MVSHNHTLSHKKASRIWEAFEKDNELWLTATSLAEGGLFEANQCGKTCHVVGQYAHRCEHQSSRAGLVEGFVGDVKSDNRRSMKALN